MERIVLRGLLHKGLLIIMFSVCSCRVFFPDRMFVIDEEKLAKADTLRTPPEYVLRTGDVLAVGVFSNNGYELVDVLTRENTSYSALKYPVKQNGYVLLPMLDSVFVAGLTVGEAENLLQSRYAYYFVNPFIRIDVANRNVIFFRGRQGATTITLEREDMNLLEVLAKGGGLPAAGKAYRVRVIRGDLHHPTVFDIDLSTVEGMQQANLVMQADDIVYIETRLTSSDIIYQVTPILTLVTTLLLITTSIIAVSR